VLLVQLAGWYTRDQWRAWAIGCLLGLSLLVTVYRSYTGFGRLADIRDLITAYKTGRLTIAQLWMPCDEGALSMQQFLRHFGGVEARVTQLLETGGVRYLLFDRAMCSLPAKARSLPGCSMRPVWSGRFAGSYQIGESRCP
jgi:hypothetical protein